MVSKRMLEYDPTAEFAEGDTVFILDMPQCAYAKIHTIFGEHALVTKFFQEDNKEVTSMVSVKQLRAVPEDDNRLQTFSIS